MITHVSRAENSDLGAAAGTIASSAQTHTAGNLLVACIGNGGVAVTGVADAGGNTWHKADSYAPNLQLEQWYAWNITGRASNVVTATFASNASNRGIVVHEFSANWVNDPLGAIGKATGNTGTASAGALAPAGNSAVAVAFLIDNGNAFTAGSGYTLANFGTFFADEYKVISTTDTPTATLSSNTWDVLAVLYNETNPALTAGTISFMSATATSVTLAVTAESGGTGPYTRQGHRSPTSGFTPVAGTVLAGWTGTTFTDSTVVAGTRYYYKVVSTDSLSATSTSVEQPAKTWDAPINLGVTGDSTMTDQPASLNPTVPQAIANELAKMGNQRTITVTNEAVVGSKTADWLPGGSNSNTADADYLAAGCDKVLVDLGINDAIAAVSDTTYASNLASIVNHQVGLGRNVWLIYPTFIFPPGNALNVTEAVMTTLASYFPKIDALDNGTTIRVVCKKTADYVAQNKSLLADRVHYTQTLATNLGTLIAGDIYANVIVGTGGGGGGGSTGGLSVGVGVSF